MSTAYDVCKQLVEDDINRPDLEGKIRRRIQRALLKFHRIDFWKRDFYETEYAFTESLFRQQIDESFFQRLRAIGYVRRMAQDTTTGLWEPTGNAFDEINPERIFDGYGYERKDTMYRTGVGINLNGSVGIERVLVGWFQDPLLEPIESSLSWILSEYTSLIAEEVKRRMFKDIGKDDEAKQCEKLVAEELAALQTNNITLKVM